MSESPQAAIRRYLDEQGGRVDALVGQLMQIWELQTWTAADRSQVSQALLSVDVYSEPALDNTTGPNDAVVLYVAQVANAPQGDPAEIALATVEQNGGSYRTDVRDLLSLFGRQQLTTKARLELTQELMRVGISVRPDLSLVERNDPIELSILAPAAAATAPAPPRVSQGSGWGRLWPRTWKGWLAYGIAGIFVISAVQGDDSETDGGGDSEPAVQQSAPANDGEEAAQAAAERGELEREKAQLERERAQVRKERARARQARAAIRQKRAREARAEEQQRREALAAAAPPPPRAAERCHPSYDPCLSPTASDYDCAGGSGDGPEYTGPVTVTGSDDYDLDSDGDGSACES